jgi:2,4-dichlorophenol 6-monooxygenase
MAEHGLCDHPDGDEFGRIRSWGTPICAKGEHDHASPGDLCDPAPTVICNLSVVYAAALRGSDVRFQTEYLSNFRC